MTLKFSLVVIAGLDPAIHVGGASVLDRRVEPGDDTGVVQSGRSRS
jgi:hypothetical protein